MRNLLFLLPLLMLANACEQKNVAEVVLNEICGKDQDGLEWVEVGNASKDAVNMKGYKLVKMDEDGIDKTIYKFPDTLLAPGAIMIVNAEELKARIPNKKAAVIELVDPNGNTADAFDSEQELDLDGHAKGESYARIPNITGNWTLCKETTWNASNDSEPTADETDDLFDKED